MKRRDRDLEPELAAFLQHRPIERRAPPELRARVLARARATVTPASKGMVRWAPPAAAFTLPARRGRLSLRIALAAVLAIASAGVGAAAALRARNTPAADPTTAAMPDPSPTVNAARPSPATSAVRSEPAPVERRRLAPELRRARSLTSEQAFPAELQLLQRAHAAYTRDDFSVTLGLIAEHAQRFPKGQLAEQREALRVRSLVGAGRTSEAHRAATAFARQFPRSVLLPRVEEDAGSSLP